MQVKIRRLPQARTRRKHPNFTAQPRPDVPPLLRRKSGPRERDVKRCTFHDGGIWIDALFQDLGAIRQVEQTDGGSEKRGAFASRLHQGGAATKTVEEQGNGWRADTSADINQRAGGFQPRGFNELQGVEKENLCKLGIVTRSREIGARAPGFRGVEIGGPAGRNRDLHGTAELLDHTHASPHAVAVADTVADTDAGTDAGTDTDTGTDAGTDPVSGGARRG